MMKKKILKPVLDPLEDLPVKIVSEDPEEDEDDDSEEPDELEEPDEDKHASSGQDDSTPHRGASRKELNLSSGVRRGNIPIVPAELDDRESLFADGAIGRLRPA